MLRIKRVLAQSHSGSYPEPGRRLKAELRIGACSEAPDTSRGPEKHTSQLMIRERSIQPLAQGSIPSVGAGRISFRFGFDLLSWSVSPSISAVVAVYLPRPRRRDTPTGTREDDPRQTSTWCSFFDRWHRVHGSCNAARYTRSSSSSRPATGCPLYMRPGSKSLAAA